MTMHWRRPLFVVLVALGAPLLDPGSSSAQCAMCRRAFASPEGQQLVAAFRAGILFLLVVPLACFATIACLAVRRQRRRDAARSASEYRAAADRGALTWRPTSDGGLS